MKTDSELATYQLTCGLPKDWWKPFEWCGGDIRFSVRNPADGPYAYRDVNRDEVNHINRCRKSCDVAIYVVHPVVPQGFSLFCQSNEYRAIIYVPIGDKEFFAHHILASSGAVFRKDELPIMTFNIQAVSHGLFLELADCLNHYGVECDDPVHWGEKRSTNGRLYYSMETSLLKECAKISTGIGLDFQDYKDTYWIGVYFRRHKKVKSGKPDLAEIITKCIRIVFSGRGGFYECSQ